MKLTKMQLRKIINEACDLSSQNMEHDNVQIDQLDHDNTPNVPSPDDYKLVRETLNQMTEIIDLAIHAIMKSSGASCERSTAQAIIDHLQDKLDNINVKIDDKDEVVNMPSHDMFMIKGPGFN